MAFKEDLEKAVEKIEDETLRAEILNNVDQAHSLDVGGLKDNSEKLKSEKLDIQAKLEEKESVLASFKGLEGKTISDFQEQEKKIADLIANPGDEAKLKEIQNKADIQFQQEKEAHKAYIAVQEAKIVEKDAKIKSLDQEINIGLSQNALTSALESVNVKAELKPMLAQALQNDIYVDVDALGNRKVKFKHKDINFDIKEGISTWAGAPENKTFIGAIRNAGAGAQGSSGAGSGIDKPFNELTYEEEVKYFKRDPEGYRQAKANAGK